MVAFGELVVLPGQGAEDFAAVGLAQRTLVGMGLEREAGFDVFLKRGPGGKAVLTGDDLLSVAARKLGGAGGLP